MDRSLETLSSYAASLSYKGLTDAAIKAAKVRIIDTIGCALGGYTSRAQQNRTPPMLLHRLSFERTGHRVSHSH